MAVREIELRVAALEAEVTRMKKRLEESSPRGDWLDAIYGAFADDPHFEEAMRLGRKYRESLRPQKSAAPVRRAEKNAGKKPGKPFHR